LSMDGNRDQPNMEPQGCQNRGAVKFTGWLTPEPSHATERGRPETKGYGMPKGNEDMTAGVSDEQTHPTPE